MSDSSIAAPGPLERVRSFVNTLDVEDGVDSLAAVEDLQTWLGSQGAADDRSPCRVEDLDRTKATLRIGIAGQGESYVFNSSGQSIDLSGLLCLFDAEERLVIANGRYWVTQVFMG